jgi:abortive infection bacteriophage resistance protein
MKYTKPPLTYPQQADLLLSRGLIADKQDIINKLQAVSYYRLTGYWYPFRNPDDTFKPATTLEHIWRRYTFDRQLRLLVLDAIERVEISVRTGLVYYHSHAFGSFGYTDGTTLPYLNKNEFTLLQGKFRDAVKQSKEIFVVHFQNKYGDVHSDLPLWMLAELLSFGTMFTFFRGVDKTIKRNIAMQYGIAFGVLESWLHSLNTVRNVCAHHSRLWNRIWGIKPILPDKNLQWHTPVQVQNDRIFGTLTILKYMLNIAAPQSRWQNRLEELMQRYPDISLKPMGFPVNWKECPIWKI